ncbi:hypothetical protein [Streptomyces stelliscabiei]|uniref:Uncharacterized protein n=1 Tax=Streptomyces stelliscabiei TaxID=146820 RepID=A0A8I0TTL5_9ACTN|nr:hypothetical protein [Streptomyces stelliscabiei]MBE1599869.1 hypothetical protein [Streptomyces stelliscabiei]
MSFAPADRVLVARATWLAADWTGWDSPWHRRHPHRCAALGTPPLTLAAPPTAVRR